MSNVHPNASRIVIVFVLGQRLVKTGLDWNKPPFKEYSYGAEPPTPLAVIVPLQSPKHNGSVCSSVPESIEGSVKLIVVSFVHPEFTSVTVTVYGPPASSNPVNGFTAPAAGLVQLTL